MTQVMHGTVSGSTIHLASNPGLEDGQRVEVILRPIEASTRQPGDGIRAAFGGWSDDAEGLDEYIRQVYEARHSDQRELPE